ncbi:Cytochrome P450 [Macrophomina phaseolina MS6]|uniref:Cytochrome P450 n=2 Tax=Macrophomina phaseolina TaxID=35725 RepID=K2QKM8_MACPH|nr:Cytochrome P450 [Macrophomina phaseolina MS6]KAH7042832.1 membrane bound O-acyl transferase family-domain-containing protein [Macrophomina phaseolina]
MMASFVTPLDQREPTPPWFLPSFLLPGFCALLIPPKFYYARALLSGSALAYLLLQAPRYTASDAAVDFIGGVYMGAVALKWLDFVVLHRTESEYHRSNPSASNPDINTGQFDSWISRLSYSFSLWTTTRGVGWSWQVKNIPRGVLAGYPRLRFVRMCLHRALWCLLGADFLHSVMMRTPFNQSDPLPNLFLQPLPTRLLVAWTAGFEAYCHLQLPYYIFATLTVALGISHPEQWPPIMGAFSVDSWSVRNFWGKCWHQQIRRSISTLTEPAVRLLRLPEKGLIARYVKIYVAFLSTAACHHLGAYLISRTHGDMYWLWLSQATVIMLEDFVIWLGKKAGVRDSALIRSVGFVWTYTWLSGNLTLPIASGIALHAGAARDPCPVGLADRFPLPSVGDGGFPSLWVVVVDRGVAFYFVAQALTLLEAESWSDVRKALWGGGAAVALALRG